MTILLECHTCKKEFKRTSNGVLKYCSKDCMMNGEYGINLKTINIGRKHSEAVRRANSERAKRLGLGKRLQDPEVRAKAIVAANLYRREHSSFYKGEMKFASFRDRLRCTLEYEAWRKECLERDNYTCQICGEIAIRPQVDHLKGFTSILVKYKIQTYEEALNCTELWDIQNGRTLCLECHKKTETYGYKALKSIRKENNL